MIRRFTDKFVKNAKPRDGKETTYREAGGFALRVRPNGSKSWLFVYSRHGKRRHLTIGAYPAMPLSAARVAFLKARSDLAQGIDPAADKQARLHAEREALAREALEPTVSDLIDEYLERHAKVNKRSWRTDELRLRKHLEPALGKRRAVTVTARDIALMLDKAGTGPGVNRLLSVTRSMFRFAVRRGLLPADPSAMVQPPFLERHRDRALSVNELQALLQQLDQFPPWAAQALRLQLATGCRIGEIVGARWSEFGAGLWTIPASRYKTRREHVVPLNRHALAVLEALAPGEFLFPTKRGDAARQNVDFAQVLKNRLGRLKGVAPFTSHDIRRTVSTQLSEMGINRLVVQRVLGHVDPSITARYDRADYLPQVRAALEAWANRLDQIVSGKAGEDNVRLLR